MAYRFAQSDSSIKLSVTLFLPLRGCVAKTRQNLVYFHTCSPWLAPMQAVTGKTREEITLEVQDMSWGTFKPLLADATVEHLVSLCSGVSSLDVFAAILFCRELQMPQLGK